MISKLNRTPSPVCQCLVNRRARRLISFENELRHRCRRSLVQTGQDVAVGVSIVIAMVAWPSRSLTTLAAMPAASAALA
jgi:hypothetical protein